MDHLIYLEESWQYPKKVGHGLVSFKFTKQCAMCINFWININLKIVLFQPVYLVLAQCLEDWCQECWGQDVDPRHLWLSSHCWIWVTGRWWWPQPTSQWWLLRGSWQGSLLLDILQIFRFVFYPLILMINNAQWFSPFLRKFRPKIVSVLICRYLLVRFLWYHWEDSC